MWIDILGYVGTVLLGVTLVPQVVKTYQVQSACELSWCYLILQIISNVIFIVYGYFIWSLPIIISNSIVFLCSGSLIFAKMKYRFNDTYERLRDISP